MTAATSTDTAAASASTSLQAGENSVWYFAYGSNMNPKTLTGVRNVEPERSEACIVPAFCLSFSHRGFPFAEPGFATLVSPDDQRVATINGEGPRPVEGVVHLISTADWLQIQRTEGVGSTLIGYQVVEVECELYDGQRVKALTLQTHDNTLAPPGRTVLPSARYMGILTEGAKHSNLSPEYCQYLAALPEYQPQRLSKRVAWYVMLATLLTFASPTLPFIFTYRAIAKKYYKDTQAPLWWVQAYIFFAMQTLTWTLHDVVLRPVFGSGSCNTGGWGPVKAGQVAGATAELNMQPIPKKSE